MGTDIHKYDEFKPKLAAIKYKPLISIQTNNYDNESEDKFASDVIPLKSHDAKQQSKAGERRKGFGGGKS